MTSEPIIFVASHQGIFENNMELFKRVEVHLQNKQYYTIQRMRRVFQISGSLAGIMLRACGFVPNTDAKRPRTYVRREYR